MAPSADTNSKTTMNRDSSNANASANEKGNQTVVPVKPEATHVGQQQNQQQNQQHNQQHKAAIAAEEESEDYESGEDEATEGEDHEDEANRGPATTTSAASKMTSSRGGGGSSKPASGAHVHHHGHHHGHHNVHSKRRVAMGAGGGMAGKRSPSSTNLVLSPRGSNDVTPASVSVPVSASVSTSSSPVPLRSQMRLDLQKEHVMQEERSGLETHLREQSFRVQHEYESLRRFASPLDESRRRLESLAQKSGGDRGKA